MPPKGCDASNRGYPSLPESAVKKTVAAALEAGIPLLAHANGDVAAELLIEAAETADQHKAILTRGHDPLTDGLRRSTRTHGPAWDHAFIRREPHVFLG